MKKYFKKLGLLFLLIATINTQTVAFANVLVNDYHTNSWDRFSYSYDFSSGADYSTSLGRATSTSIATNNTNNNVRVNKDFSYSPLSYGVFSSEIETEMSNPYFSPLNYNQGTIFDVTNYSYNPYVNNQSSTANFNTSTSTGFSGSTSTGYNTTSSNSNSNSSNSSSSTGLVPHVSTPTELPIFSFGDTNNDVEISYSDVNNSSINYDININPLYYDDGSIGTLAIPNLGKNLKVYEGESLDNLKKGVAHFSFMSTWDGNVGIAGHNDDEFLNLWTLNLGDKVTYTTKYGVRDYAISSIDIVNVDDFTTLNYTLDNRLTLITCVQGQEDKRYSIVATAI